MANQLFNRDTPGVTPNLKEIGKIVREMSDESVAKHKAANNFSELGAAVVQQGIDDKTRSRGWPVSKLVVSEKKTL